MIIDAKTQLGPGLRTDSPLQPSFQISTAEELIAILDRVAIERAIVHPPRWLGGTRERDFIDPNYEQANAAIAEAVRKHPKRLIGFGRVNPKFGAQAAAELEKCFRTYGFRGLFLDNDAEGFSYRDVKLLAPLLEICAARRAPVMVYTWLAPSQPVSLFDLARAFPGVNMILAHSGWQTLGDPLIVLEYAKNLYLETSFSNSKLVQNNRKRFGAERIVFGSNIPYGVPEVELQRIRRWGELSPTQVDLVLGGNIAQLIGLAA